jgi:hypothetical protein
MSNCNGYGDAPNPNAKYPWQFTACPGCPACAHLPRCKYCAHTARNGRGECSNHIAERRRHEQAAEADRHTSALFVLAQRIADGAKFDCEECGDGLVTDSCVTCCPHDDVDDHKCCLTCGADCFEDYVAAAEYAYEGER